MDSENSFSSNVHKIDQFFFTHQKEDDYISYQEDEEQSEQEYKGRKRRKGTFPFDRLLYKCEWSDCPFSTKSIAKFYNHEYTHVQEQIAVNSFECRWNQCQFVAKDSNELNMHFSYHPYLQRLMAIGELTKEIRNLPDCQLPYRSIIPENLAWFCCKWADCMYAFLRLNDFILHVTLGHVSITRNDSKKSSGKKNKDKNNGEDELNENNGKRKYLCEWRECGVCCNSYFGLVSHVRTHTTERRVACSDCGSTFVSREVFQDHIDRQVKFEEEDLTSRKMAISTEDKITHEPESAETTELLVSDENSASNIKYENLQLPGENFELPTNGILGTDLVTIVSTTNLQELNTKLDTIIKNQQKILENFAQFNAKFDTVHFFENKKKSFWANFEPIKNLEQLENFEELLKDENIQRDIIDNLQKLDNRTGGKNYAYQIIDLIINREFLTMCSWGGGSKKAEKKIGLKFYKNLFNLFYVTVNSIYNSYTLADTEAFFKSITRNAGQRSDSKRMRTSTTKNKKKTQDNESMNLSY